MRYLRSWRRRSQTVGAHVDGISRRVPDKGCGACCGRLSTLTQDWTSPAAIDNNLLFPMDIIDPCLSLEPVSYLVPAVAMLRFIWLSVQQVQASKQQLQTLAQIITQLLWTLNGEYTAGQLQEGQTSTSLTDRNQPPAA